MRGRAAIAHHPLCPSTRPPLRARPPSPSSPSTPPASCQATAPPRLVRRIPLKALKGWWGCRERRGLYRRLI
jgi:hypothetical protein